MDAAPTVIAVRCGGDVDGGDARLLLLGTPPSVLHAVAADVTPGGWCTLNVRVLDGTLQAVQIGDVHGHSGVVQDGPQAKKHRVAPSPTASMGCSAVPPADGWRPRKLNKVVLDGEALRSKFPEAAPVGSDDTSEATFERARRSALQTASVAFREAIRAHVASYERLPSMYTHNFINALDNYERSQELGSSPLRLPDRGTVRKVLRQKFRDATVDTDKLNTAVDAYARALHDNARSATAASSTTAPPTPLQAPPPPAEPSAAQRTVAAASLCSLANPRYRGRNACARSV